MACRLGGTVKSTLGLYQREAPAQRITKKTACMSEAPEQPAGPGSELEARGVGDPVPCFGFQADTMNAEDNAAAWREAVGTLFEVDELAWGEPGPFRADLVSYALGPVVLGATRASGQRFRRTPETIARSGVDHVIVQLYTGGGYDGVAGSRPMQVRAGDICVFDLAQTLETRATAFANVTLVVPRPRMEACLSHPEALHGLVLPSTNVTAALIGRHLQALIELAPAMTLTDCEPVIEGSVGLIAACLRAESERSAFRAVALCALPVVHPLWRRRCLRAQPATTPCLL